MGGRTEESNGGGDGGTYGGTSGGGVGRGGNGSGITGGRYSGNGGGYGSDPDMVTSSYITGRSKNPANPAASSLMLRPIAIISAITPSIRPVLSFFVGM